MGRTFFIFEGRDEIFFFLPPIQNFGELGGTIAGRE